MAFRTVLGISLFVAVLPLAAQSGVATIQGTVRDISGAVVVNASVSALHVETGRRQATISTQIGYFQIPMLPIGAYRLSVEASGMQNWVGELVLQVGQTADVEAVLKVGGTVTEVTVPGDLTQVTEDTATVAQTLERQRIEQLPLNGRFFDNLVGVTTPGIEGWRANGMIEAAMDLTLDGVTLTNREGGIPPTRPPGLDTIQEFRVEISNSSAKMNRPATVIATTKSGTNEVHGSAFETARNDGLGVARRRQDYYDKPPHLVRNEFGASLGGPVWLPRVYDGRNRTFFFFAYEAYKNMAASTVSTTMPTMAMRQGDFSGLVDSVGRRYTLYDPWSTSGPTWQRVPFTNNQIPMTRQSPLAKYLYSITPVPTLPQVNPVVSANYFAPGPNTRTDNTFTNRLDHRFSDRNTVYLRYSHGSSSSGSVGNAVPTLDKAANIGYTTARDDSAVFSLSHIFSPRFFGETVVGWSYEGRDLFSGEPDRNYTDMLGLPNPFRGSGWPNIGGTGFGMTYIQSTNRRYDRTWIASLDQNFTRIAGRHEFQFGGRMRNDRFYILTQQAYASGVHSFASCATCLYDPASGTAPAATTRTGHDAASLFLGIAANYSVRFDPKVMRLREREYAGYFQDNWRLSPRLSLNFGMRYEFHPRLHEKQNLLAGFDYDTHAIVLGNPLERYYESGRATPQIVSLFQSIGIQFETPQKAGLPNGLVRSDPWGFSPRFGFAYKLATGSRPMVLRGGYSLFSYSPSMRILDAFLAANPPFRATFTTSYTTAAQSPDGLANYAMRSVPSTVAGMNSTNVIDPSSPTAIARGSVDLYFMAPNQPVSRIQEWNLLVEREVMKNTVARASYIGKHGFNLDQYAELNDQPNAYIWYTTQGVALPTGAYASVARRALDQTSYGSMQRYQKTGWSNYNGIQLEFQRRYSRGYAFQIFYVMGNALRAGGNGFRDGLITTTNAFLPGAVPTDVDARNRFLNYQRDTDIPKHRLRWNWLVDLPVGQGKWLGGAAGPKLNRLIGGWQVAGFGTLRSNYFALPTSNWGALNPITVYGTQYKIEDCRSGRCIPGYLYYNGFLPANRINSYDRNGVPNGIMGVAADYKPAHQPVIPIPADGGSAADPNFAFYNTNTVFVKLKNGNLQRTTLDTNLHPWTNQYLPAPWSQGLDASIFKTTRITERVSLRFNGDFFNVLNMPGLPAVNSDTGIISLQNSANPARQLQLTLRLIW